jgi:hypothetical protein
MSVSSIFPNSNGSVAKYNSVTLTVSIDAYERREFSEAVKNWQDFTDDPKIYLRPKSEEIISTVYHEYRHWIDHVSTLWGQNNIIKVINAIAASAQQKVKDFYHIPLMFKELYRERVEKYFTVVYPHTPESRPWRYTITLGFKFNHLGEIDNEDPVMFVRFANYENEPLARVPLSVISLLELNAIREEVCYKAANILLISDRVERETKLRALNEQYLKGVIYNKNLVQYNVAAHIFSNLMNCVDGFGTITNASFVSMVSLNMPVLMAKKIRCPEIMESNKATHRHLLNKIDRGYIYFCLVSNYAQKFNSKFNSSLEVDFKDLLTASGILNLDEFFRAFAVEFDGLPSQKILSPYKDYYLNLHGVGQHLNLAFFYYQDIKLPVVPKIITNLPNLELPFTLFADDYYDEPTNNQISRSSTNLDWYFFAEKHYNFCHDFYEICR